MVYTIGMLGDILGDVIVVLIVINVINVILPFLCDFINFVFFTTDKEEYPVTPTK